MEQKLKHIIISNFQTEKGFSYSKIPLSYQVFGQELGTSPVILVNHALTGNSEITGKNGWWNPIVGTEKSIDLNKFTVLIFNIPGNGFDQFYIPNYKDFTLKDIAKLFQKGLEELQIDELHSIIGGSIGGALTWELAFSFSKVKNIVSIASDWKTTNWLKANLHIQEILLESDEKPLQKARKHAMNFYRNPDSYKVKFENTKNAEVLDWLDFHGEKLSERFDLRAYKLVNHLLGTIEVFPNEKEFISKAKELNSSIHIVGIDSDLLFPASENREIFLNLKSIKENVFYHEISSPHGHDAFLIEHDQVANIIQQIL
ncbi:alpha/beta fold hydrolase [Aureivirga sp. CE67]|uniref:alpha/beta fold hydrolase n=1 Tax=Aureivirga sp. CE67 TaxID=1788983 RepID=UPI001E310D69|nr:alpha/beta fold hydrolase [Aureivirga sp. CE67]